MVRVLHLLGVAPDFQTRQGLSALSRLAGDKFSFTQRTIGRGGTYRNTLAACLSLGMRPDDFDLIHAWDDSAVQATLVVKSQRIVFSPAHIPSRATGSWLRLGFRQGVVQVVCASAAQQRALERLRIRADDTHLIRPGVEPAHMRSGHDRSLREALGIGEQDYVLLPAGESTRAAGHRDAVWAASILHVLDQRYRVLLWGEGDQTRSLERLVEKLGQPGLLVNARRVLGRRVEFHELLRAADVALYTPESIVPELPIATAIAAGLPVAGWEAGSLPELFAGAQGAAMVWPPSARLLAQQILKFREDPQWGRPTALAARVEARKAFSFNRFIEQYRALYRSMNAS